MKKAQKRLFAIFQMQLINGDLYKDCIMLVVLAHIFLNYKIKTEVNKCSSSYPIKPPM